MPIATIRDDDHHRLTLTVTDPWSAEEIANALDRQVSSELWNYATVYDLRETRFIPSEPDLLWLVKHAQQQVARHGARGPVAELIDGAGHGADLRRYAELGGVHSHVRVRVFTDVVAANAWLASSAADPSHGERQQSEP